MSKKIKCNLCQSDNHKVLESQPAHNLVKCNDCDLVYVSPQPEPKTSRETYDKPYYDKWLMEEKKKARQKMWQKRLAILNASQRGGKLLDVGCGVGTFLKLAQASRWEVAGTEVSDYAAQKCKEQLRISIFNGSLKKASFQENTFDAITMWHVLEHLSKPLETLQEAHRILKKDSLLIIAVPNFKSILAKVKLLRQKGTQRIFRSDSNEPHLYHFTSKTLKEILEKASFKVLKIDLDEPSVSILQTVYDKLAKVLFYTLKINVSRALLAVAQKKENL